MVNMVIVIMACFLIMEEFCLFLRMLMIIFCMVFILICFRRGLKYFMVLIRMFIDLVLRFELFWRRFLIILFLVVLGVLVLGLGFINFGMRM